MKPTFENTVDILVEAYLNDTLMHGNCYACAVGNIVASGLSCDVVKQPYHSRQLIWSNGLDYPAMNGEEIQGWGAAFVTDFDFDEFYVKRQKIKKGALEHPSVKKQIDATGYTWQELANIEYAFEMADRGENDDEWMFNGLMKVLDALARIHNVDLTVREEAKSLFVKA